MAMESQFEKKLENELFSYFGTIRTVREYWCFYPCIIFAHCYKKLVFLPQLSIIDTRQARKNLTTKFKNLATRIK